MKFQKYIEKYGIIKSITVFNFMFTDKIIGSKKRHYKRVVRFTKLRRYLKNEKLLNEEIPLIKKDKAITRLMFDVEPMIRSKDCPTSIKNRFYSYKHRYIKYLLDNKLINMIMDCGDFYKFYSYDLYFLQPKFYFKNNLEVSGCEEYIGNTDKQTHSLNYNMIRQLFISITSKLKTNA